MIYTDEETGIVNVVYGQGSIMGVITEPHNGYIYYGLISTDKHPIGQECQNWDEIKGKLDCDAGVMVRLLFNKVESIDIIIKDLQNIRKDLLEMEGKK